MTLRYFVGLSAFLSICAFGGDRPDLSQVLPEPGIPYLSPTAVDVDGDGDLDLVFPAMPTLDGYMPYGMLIENLGKRRFDSPRVVSVAKADKDVLDSYSRLGSSGGNPSQEFLVTEYKTRWKPPKHVTLKVPVAIRFAPLGGMGTRRTLAPAGLADWIPLDLDGDGVTELIQFDASPRALRIWDRKPDGTYAQKAPAVALRWIPMGRDVPDGDPSNYNDLKLQSVDFDGDGDLDIVMVDEESGKLAIFERTWHRSFSRQIKFADPGDEINFERDGRFIDLDGDGRTDYCSSNGRQFYSARNLGGFSMSPIRGRRLLGGQNDSEIRLLKVISAPGQGALLAFGVKGSEENSASIITVRYGSWQVVSRQPFGISPSMSPGYGDFFETIEDFDGDGRLDALVRFHSADLFAADSEDRLAIAWGGADGMSEAVFIGPPPLSADSVSLGDYDRDGDVDLIIGPDSEGNGRLLANDGTGNFSKSRTLSELKPPAEFPGDTSVAYQGIADMNDDGIPDILVAYTGKRFDPSGHAIGWNSVTGIATGRGDGSFRKPEVSLPDFYKASPVERASWIVDFDMDGDLDMIGSEGYWKNRNGGFPTPFKPLIAGATTTDPLGNPFKFSQSTCGDLDGDGFPDFISGIASIQTSGSTMKIGFNDGQGKLTGIGAVDATINGRDPMGNLTVPGQVAIADMDKDGIQDLFTVEVTGLESGLTVLEAKWRKNPGRGARDPWNWPVKRIVAPGVESAVPWPVLHTSAPTLDFDGDGKLEWVSPSGYLRATPRGPVLSMGYDFDGHTDLVRKLDYVGAADFDGDGDADFLLSDSSAGALFLMNNPTVAKPKK